MLGDFAGSAGYFVEESAKLGGVFFAGAGFDAASHIDGVRADNADCFTHIFGRESARENHALRLRDGAGQMPIAGGARASVLAGNRGIEKKRRGAAITRKFGRGSSLPDVHRFDDGQATGDGVNNLLGFLAVELGGG